MPCDVILALDAPSPREVEPTLRKLAGTLRWVKVGLEMYTACGPDCVRRCVGLGFSVFLDLKLHDIPNTVAGAVASASRLPIRMLTLHASGGRAMMQAAARARAEHAPELLLLGVTVLTSLSDNDLHDIGAADTAAGQVGRLGRLAADSGLGGLVCSPREIARLRAELPPGIRLVAPGIRPKDAPADDQARTMAAGEAARAGADFLVVGRPILKAPDPAAAARALLAEVS